MDAEGPHLFDDGSTGGTFVGEVRVTSKRLRPGDVISAGDSKLRYLIEAADDETTLAKGLQNPPPAKSGSVPQLKDLVGQQFADYRLDEIITMGHSGMVFRGTDMVKNRPVAVKVLTPDLARSEEQKERFVRAMKTTSPIRHPNIVRLYNAGKKGPFCWAAMEYIDGESLISVIDRIGVEGMLDWRDVWHVAVHVGSALTEAYNQQIIHRNVTPTNIMRRKSDKSCVLGDLMLAKGLQGALAQQVTQPGQLIGDLPYMSPERTQSDAEVDCRSDLYGLGATLYALLTGRPPVDGEVLPVLVKNVRQQVPESPKKYQLAVNDLFGDLVMRLLEKRPEDRYETPGALLKDLDRIGNYNGLTA
jgi:serine/threonine protein kinase